VNTFPRNGRSIGSRTGPRNDSGNIEGFVFADVDGDSGYEVLGTGEGVVDVTRPGGSPGP
jgi:hypothetical protein